MRPAQLRAVLGYLHRVANPDSGSPDDTQLLKRWRNQRDPAAFEVLVWRHGALVWNLCRRILRREQDVEDAFQATFLTFLRKADSIGQGRFLSSWLYRVAYRTALGARAASARHTGYRQLEADFLAAAANEAVAWDEVGAVLDEEVNRLPEKYRRPFVLCYLEGKTTDEAARDLGCPRGTVGTRLAWARERLRSRLTRRGLALSAPGLAALLSEKAGAASVPAALVSSTVQAAIFSAAGRAVATGVISARAVALTQGVLQAMNVAKLKTITLILGVAGILGSGAGLLTYQALADQTEKTQTAGKSAAAPAEERIPPNRDSRDRAEEETLVFAEEDKTEKPQGKGTKGDPPQLSGKVVRVDKDDKGLALEVPSKKETSGKVEITITDKTRLRFSNVGPKEARLTEGYDAHIWLEKDSKDVAARVQLSGHRYLTGSVLNEKLAPPHLTLPVVAVADGGKGITLERSGKGEQPAEKIPIQFTDKTRVFFFNVPRDGARPKVGYEARVWLEDNSRDTARAVRFVGNAEGKPPEGKGQPADRSGRIVGLSGNGKVLTVELPPVKGEEPAKVEIKLTDRTKESYHGVTADGAKPVQGYQVQVWLAEGSQDTAARVRFFRPDPRKSVDARVQAVSADGSRLTVESVSQGKGGESTRQEIKITAKTRLVFFNVGPGGAKLTEGYHVRGWLVEGSEDTAEELMLSRSEKPTDK
jgi:RNA polymerase sigma factor (sigma-70 family)